MFNGRGIYGGVVYPPLRTFLTSDFVLQDTKKIVCQCYQNNIKASVVKIFHFSDEWKVVSVAPQRGGVCFETL